jgi:hypothetical protein
MLAAFLGGALAAVFAGHRVLTRPVLEQWRRTAARQRHSRLALAADATLAVAAVLALVVLRIAHRNGTAALLAPGLLVIAVALLGTPLLPVAARVLLPATRATKRLGLFLAGRQVVRRPAGLRLATLLAVAVGLATFAVCGEAVATVNRGARAQAELGSAERVSVHLTPSADPVAVTHRLDPAGNWAMAAGNWAMAAIPCSAPSSRSTRRGSRRSPTTCRERRAPPN